MISTLSPRLVGDWQYDIIGPHGFNVSMDEYELLGSNAWPAKDIAMLIELGAVVKGERYDTADQWLSVIMMRIRHLPKTQQTYILESISAELSKILHFVDDLMGTDYVR